MAWDDTKSTGNSLTAAEWNAHVTDQKSRLANVVEDTTPQLGGNLDLNSSDITGTGNINITGTITASDKGTFDELSIENAGTCSFTLVDNSVELGAINTGNSNFQFRVDNGADFVFRDVTNGELVRIDATGNLTAQSGDISGGIFTESHATSHTLSAAECYGAVYYVTAAATLTLPAVQDGMSLTVTTVGAVAVSVDPNASDKIWLDGTALDDGDKLTNSSTSGDTVTLVYYSADGWFAFTDGNWTDGGA